MIHVFVYGTLMQGERNHHLLKSATCVYREAYVFGKLLDTGFGYPAWVYDKDTFTYGEVYEVDSSILKELDQLEDYREGRDHNLFERIKITAYNDRDDHIDCYIYAAGERLMNSTIEIPHGNWSVYKYLQKSTYYYFAYGSCMDHERFKEHGVDAYFQSIIGKGILRDYGFRFSRESLDGGKADIISSPKEIVEGVIYNVPKEALDYLYKREGVFFQSYRPIVVEVTLKDEKRLRVITFTGVEKSQETPPTKHYAEEIFRGASNILSDTYRQKLQERIDRLGTSN
ncbi:gamma-glutamylcyclotransferase [Oceanobacillus piezotolerans]|nr:gamma-glutamylcyclotransferase [Oceanobacillus piezotolerans]